MAGGDIDRYLLHNVSKREREIGEIFILLWTYLSRYYYYPRPRIVLFSLSLPVFRELAPLPFFLVLREHWWVSHRFTVFPARESDRLASRSSFQVQHWTIDAINLIEKKSIWLFSFLKKSFLRPPCSFYNLTVVSTIQCRNWPSVYAICDII